MVKKRVTNRNLKTQLNRIERKVDIAWLVSWFFFGFAFIVGSISLSKYLGLELNLFRCFNGNLVTSLGRQTSADS